MVISRQIPRLEQLATKRVLLGTHLGHSALIHTPPSRSSNVILWRRSARGACLFLLAVLGCLQASAQQKPASPLDEFERRFAAANSAKEAGDLPAAAAASEKIVALGLREMGKLRLFEAAYPEAARFSRRSLEFEDVADAHVDLAAANLFTSRLDEAGLPRRGGVFPEVPRDSSRPRNQLRSRQLFAPIEREGTERHIAQEIVRKKISRVDSQLLEKLPVGLRREHPCS